MYAALWRALPGPALVRALICLALLVLFVVVCFQWIFPWIAAMLPVNDPSVSGSAVPGLPAPTAATGGPYAVG